MKKLFINVASLLIALLAVSSICEAKRYPSIIPTAMNTINSVTLEELNLKHGTDYTILKTVSVDGIVVVHSSRKDITVKEINGEFTLEYSYDSDGDWDRISFFLHRASSPKAEANKQVKGTGNTSLEHATIHWNVDSRPQGADVSWRAISSTPEVKNQNYRYLSTTPFESTEVFDIKGLTYNNGLQNKFIATEAISQNFISTKVWIVSNYCLYQKLLA